MSLAATRSGARRPRSAIASRLTLLLFLSFSVSSGTLWFLLFILQFSRQRQRLQNLLHLFYVLIADALAPHVAPLQAVQHVLPHLPSRSQPLVPLATPRKLPFE